MRIKYVTVSTLFSFFFVFQFFGIQSVFAENLDTQKPILEFFYGSSCPHCHKEKEWFPELKEQFPNLIIQEHEVWENTENADIWKERMAAFDMVPTGVPTNIIGESVIVGFKKADILAAVQSISGDSSSDTSFSGEEEVFWKKYLKSYSWPIMAFILGLIDGFNPCAMWSLLVLLGFLMTMEDKRRRWLIGGIFLASSGILYGGALLAYLFGFQEITIYLGGGVMIWLFRLVGVMAIASAFMSFYAYYKNKVECEMRDVGEKQKFHKKLSNLLKKEDLFIILPGVIALAFSVNAIELLCSFAIPTAFVATLLQMDLNLPTQLSAVGIYDFAYMLDDIIVFLIAMFTLSFATVSPKMIRISHLVGGIVLLILGILLMTNMELLAFSSFVFD